MANLAAMFTHPVETDLHTARASALAGVLTQAARGVYVNFLADGGEQRVREAYPGPTWDRLRRVKGRYDPTNQNIPPEG